MVQPQKGEFGWVNESLNNDFFNRCISEHFDLCIGGAFPGFMDYYMEGGWGPGYTDYDDQDGLLFDEGFMRAGMANIGHSANYYLDDYGEELLLNLLTNLDIIELSKSKIS